MLRVGLIERPSQGGLLRQQSDSHGFHAEGAPAEHVGLSDVQVERVHFGKVGEQLVVSLTGKVEADLIIVTAGSTSRGDLQWDESALIRDMHHVVTLSRRRRQGSSEKNVIYSSQSHAFIATNLSPCSLTRWSSSSSLCSCKAPTQLGLPQ